MVEKIKSILVDIDNTITIESSNSYENKEPNLELIKKLWEYKNNGYNIILYTARRMLTHNGDEAKIIKDVGLITLNWLNKHNIPFDGIKFGKPYASEFMIDDKAIRPNEFIKLNTQEINNLINPKNKND